MTDINYFWTINPLECYPTSDVGADFVFTAHWQLHAQTGSYSAQAIGTQAFEGTPAGGDFIPFEELTLEMVQGWVESAMGEEKVNQLKQSLAQNIENQINPPVVTLQSPWLNTSESI